jgi:hypothetical protein
MRIAWRTAKTLRWACLLAAIGFFALSVGSVDDADRSFERHVTGLLGASAVATLIGLIERSLRKRLR